MPLELGANDYVTKPVDFAVALARVNTQISRKRAVRTGRVGERRNCARLRKMLRRRVGGADHAASSTPINGFKV